MSSHRSQSVGTLSVRRRPLVLVAGNPNAGKSTIFNALTGSTAKVANYPGVTVDRRSAHATLDGALEVEIVDLPGTYSLSARSREEQVAVDAVLGRDGVAPDVVVVVADATALARALYLACEVIETRVPVVLGLSMTDEAGSQGFALDVDGLAAELGVPVVPLVATKGHGLAALKSTIARLTRAHGDAPLGRETPLPEPLASDVREIATAIEATRALPRAETATAWAQWLLLSLGDEGGDELVGIPKAVRDTVARVRLHAERAGRNLDLEVISHRYSRIDRILASAQRQPSDPARSWTHRIDSVLTHRVWGAITFVAVMFVVFQALFSWAEPAIALIEDGVALLQDGVRATMPSGPLVDLLIDGIIAGVGNVVVFVPQIALLFFFIGLLEDLGYLARVAFVIDRLMGSIGLHGKAFVPMLSGFSCAVPAVLATRTIENRLDRLLTMMVLPLMSCSARLPVYLLVTATVFSSSATVWGVMSAGAFTLFVMYLLSVVATLGAAAVFRRTLFRGPGATLVLELPPFRRPVFSVLLRNVWQRVRTFLSDAGTIILAMTIVLWALLSYPKSAVLEAEFDSLKAQAAQTLSGEALDTRLAQLDQQQNGARLRGSIAGRLGHIIEPAIQPLGFDWRIGIGLLGAFAAREVFVSTLGIVFDISGADETSDSLREELRHATRPDGTALMTPLTGVSLMVFFVLACQCMSTVAVVRRESGSWRWPLIMFGYMTALAYVASLAVYQGGRAIGWGLG